MCLAHKSNNKTFFLAKSSIMPTATYGKYLLFFINIHLKKKLLHTHKEKKTRRFLASFFKFSKRAVAKKCNSNSKSENQTYDPAILVQRFANFLMTKLFRRLSTALSLNYAIDQQMRQWK